MYPHGTCARTIIIQSEISEPAVFQRTGNDLLVAFPPTLPGPNTVTLANGAVIDVFQLGQVVSEFCPGLSGSCGCG